MNLQQFVEKHGQTGAAKVFGVTQGLVWQWLNGRTTVTAERAIQIEEATSGEVTRAELRPDLFGSPEGAKAA